MAVVARSFSQSTAPARTARSYWSGTRGISHSPASWLGGPGFGWLAGVGWGVPVRVGRGGGWSAAGGEVGQGPPGGVEAVAGLQAAYGLRLGDVQAVGGDGGGHDLLVQAGVAAAAAQDQGEVTAGFGEQVPTVEAPALVHHEHCRGDVDGRQGDVDHSGDPGPNRRSRGTGVLEEGGNDVGSDTRGEDRARLPPRAQLRERPGRLLGRAGLAGGDLVQLGAGAFGDHGQEPRLAVVDGGDVLVLQLCQAGGDLVATPGGPADQLVRHPGDLHHRPTPRGDDARLGRQPQRLADLRGHELVVERGCGHGVLVQGQGVDRAPPPVQALPLHGQQHMVMEQRPARAGLVVAEAGGDQTAGRPHPVDAVLAVPDHRDLVLDPLQHPDDRVFVSGLDPRRVSSSPNAHRK